MQTDQQLEENAVVLQTLTTGAVSGLKNRLQRNYEQAYPGLGNVIRIVLDEEEERPWDLSPCPHLLLPDLAEADIERLGLQLADRQHDNVLPPDRCTETQTHQPAHPDADP